MFSVTSGGTGGGKLGAIFPPINFFFSKYLIYLKNTRHLIIIGNMLK